MYRSTLELLRRANLLPAGNLSRNMILWRNSLTLSFQGLHNFFDQETMKVWDELYDSTDKYTDRWLSSGMLSNYGAAAEQFCQLL